MSSLCRISLSRGTATLALYSERLVLVEHSASWTSRYVFQFVWRFRSHSVKLSCLRLGGTTKCPGISIGTREDLTLMVNVQSWWPGIQRLGDTWMLRLYGERLLKACLSTSGWNLRRAVQVDSPQADFFIKWVKGFQRIFVHLLTRCRNVLICFGLDLMDRLRCMKALCTIQEEFYLLTIFVDGCISHKCFSWIYP